MKRIIQVLLLLLLITSCNRANNSDFEKNENDYQTVINIILNNRLKEIDPNNIPSYLNKKEIQKLFKRSKIKSAIKGYESDNHILIFKSAIPVDNYSGYIYIIDPSLPDETGRYKSFIAIRDHWGIVTNN